MRIGALECLERAVSCGPRPLSVPLAPLSDILLQRIGNEAFVSFLNKTFAESQKVQAHFVSQVALPSQLLKTRLQ